MTTFSLESDDEEEVFPLLISPCSSSSTTATPPSSVSTPGSTSSSMHKHTTRKCLSPEAFSPSSSSSSFSSSSSSSTFSFPSLNPEQKSHEEKEQRRKSPHSGNGGERPSHTPTSQSFCSLSQTSASSRSYSSYYNSGEKVKRRTEIEKDDEVDHDQITPSSVTKKFGVYIHQTLIHPPAVSPFSLSLPSLSVQESPTEEIDASSSFYCLSSCRSISGVLSSIAKEIRKMFQSSTSFVFAGLSFRGCLYEMLGIFVLTFLVHLISSSVLQARQEMEGNTLPPSVSIGQETPSGTASSSFSSSFFDQRFDFNGWNLAKRLPLLLYGLGAIFGLFCNPAFLYAGYTAFSFSSSSSSSRSLLLLSDVSKMNWISVNLLVLLHYVASGVSAFLASSILSSSSPSSVSLTRFASSSGSSASISSLPFWLAAASEALGAFLMAAAVLQFLFFSSLLSLSSASSSFSSCAPSLAEQRSLFEKDRQAEKMISAPSYSACWSSSLSSSSFDRGGSPSSSSCSSYADERRDRKKEAHLGVASSDPLQSSAFSASSQSSSFSKLLIMISGVLCLLFTCLFIPFSSSSFNPAIAYTSSCVEGWATNKTTHSNLERISPSSDFPSLRPIALSSFSATPSSSSFLEEEAKKVEEVIDTSSLTSSFVSSESAKEIRRHEKIQEGKDGLVEEEYKREKDSFPDQHANLSAVSEETVGSGVHTPPQRESSSMLRDGNSFFIMREQEREEEGEKEKNSGSFLASFVFPLSLLQGDKKDGEIESIHVLDREEGSSELLYEYDRAYDSATPCFTFLLSSVSPYIGAVSAAWVWKRTQGVGLGGK
ncbi:transmembrane protein [Cystoisospora suis]|uniref:Transmembrane protein n=1 Tax=Cystoisospora suis TaxID=483139 RepID=A0A2C6KMT2_9APIC|nr:transmembrane protein [Cystoisospora suis]